MGQDIIRVLDLFAGAGGITAGFHKASERFKTVAAVELDRSAAASFAATFGHKIVYNGSIENWLDTFESSLDIDIVVGGPPCQGFSSLGKQSSTDHRNMLWQYYANALQKSQPKYFFLENVPPFAKSEELHSFRLATQPGGKLSDYDFQIKILNAADYGAPQARKRAILIGHHRDLKFPGFPDPTHSGDLDSELCRHRTVQEAFLNVPPAPDMDAVFLERHKKPNVGLPGPFSMRELHWSRNYSILSQRRFAAIPAGGNRFNLPEELQAECWKRHKSGAGDVMGRLRLNEPSVTIRTEFFKPEKGRYIHPTEDRAITHFEAALIQGFTSEHLFFGSKTAIAAQIGNAVPIPLASAIALQLLTGFQPSR